MIKRIRFLFQYSIYITELLATERPNLHSFDSWCDALLRRFRPSMADTMTAISRQHYTAEDAANRREPEAYLQAILRHAKGSESADSISTGYGLPAHRCRPPTRPRRPNGNPRL